MNYLQMARRGLIWLALLTTSTTLARATIVVVDNGNINTPTFTYAPSSGLLHGTGFPTVNGTSVHQPTPNLADTVTWTPGQTGIYDVYVHWLAFSNHETSAVFTVNDATGGSTSLTFDLTKNGNQSNSVPMSTSLVGSGWVPLGQFSLNASSTVVSTHGATINGGPGILPADAVRIQNRATDGILLDENVFAASSTPNWGIAAISAVGGTDPQSTSVSYTFNNALGASTTYSPGLTGTYSLDLSWGVYNNSSTDVSYLIDLNGNGTQDGGDSLIHINQRSYANGTVPNLARSDWSGFYAAGTFNFTSASKIRVLKTSGTDANYLAVNTLRVIAVPEPSGLVLFAHSTVCFWIVRRNRRASVR